MARDPEVQVLGESENYAIWVSEENDPPELLYHLEIGNLTLHLFEDEWEELLGVIMEAVR